jgi:hypothetical protein
MALSLKTNGQTKSRDRLIEGARAVRAMLDSVQANVFVADLDFELVYMNRRAESTVRSIESVIRETFGVAWSDMVGGSIHRFHKDPKRIESVLRNPANFPHEAVFNFGSITLKTLINGVFDDAGQCLGYIVAWDDVSTQVVVEAKARDLATALAAASNELDAVSQQLGASAEQTSAQAGAVSAGAEELTASIKEIAEGRRLEPRREQHPDRRRGEADHVDRGPDESARAERDDRSCPCRRRREGIRGRCERGQGPGPRYG